MTLTSAPVSTKNHMPLVRSVIKIGDVGPAALVTINAWPGRFPNRYKAPRTCGPFPRTGGGTSAGQRSPEQMDGDWLLWSGSGIGGLDGPVPLVEALPVRQR